MDDAAPRKTAARRRAAEPLPPPETALRERARALGFDVCRFASVEAPWPASDRLRTFVAEGRHGQMRWMEETLERRVHPRAMWPQARSAVVLGVNYGPTADPLALLERPDRAAISVYARGDDYHEVVKKGLKALGRWFGETYGCGLKVFVDTAPLMEKPLAQAAGVGWQGKHTNLVSRDFGSWLFLGAILTDMALEPDAPETDHCGSCRACLDVCPTEAFPAPYTLDARRCLSYLTIEHAGPWPDEFRAAMGNRVYGCDDCLAVCPWNKFAAEAAEARLQAREALNAPSLAELLELDDAAFRALFAKTAVKRVGRNRFLRNVLYAAGNAGDPGLVAAVERRLDEPDPTVRGAAVWALFRLLSIEGFAALAAARLPAETDPQVRAEWLRR